MMRAKRVIGVVLVTLSVVTGCSDPPPAKPNYGSPALVVEGTEVWQPISWGGRVQFDRSDRDVDGKISPGEFTANMRREGLAQRGLKVFKILDTDGDGQLTWEEYRERPGEATIVSLDVDGNGTLSSDEFGASRQYLVKINRFQPLFVAWDRDGDKELTSEEVESSPFEAMFYDWDRDGDDQVSYEERMLRGGANRVATENDFKYRDRDGSGVISMRELCYRPRDAKFWAMDSNDNRTVSKKEFKASRFASQLDDPEEVFAGLDRNGDGRIGLSEFRERELELPEVFGRALEPKIGNPKIMFDLLDRNGDGAVVLEEIKPVSDESSGPAWEKTFEAADRNKDGRIEYEEFSKRGSQFAFAIVDESRDGRISAEEYRVAMLPWMTGERMQEIVKAVDTNGDGTFDKEEFDRRDRQARFLITDSDEDERVTREEYGQNNAALLIAGSFAGVFDAHDVDGDGALSRAEFDGIQRTSEFASMDTDGDGRLTVGEFSAPARTPKDRTWREKRHHERNTDGDRCVSRREFLTEREFAIFWELDQNADDTVSLAEFKSSKRFSRLADVAELTFRAFDLDHNGTIEINEYEMRTNGARLIELDRDGDGQLGFEEFAGAYSGPYYAHKALEVVDKDSDGIVTAAEFSERPEEKTLRSPAGALPRVEWAFGFLDLDSDGAVARDEFLSDARKSAVGPGLGGLFDGADSDGDGRLTLNEFGSHQGQLGFFSHDEDGDGLLTPEEHYATVPWASKDRAWAMVKALDENGNGFVDHSEYQRKWGLARFLLEDRNEDGKVDYEEFHVVRAHDRSREATARQFAVYDRDHDESLTPEEMETTPFGLPFYEDDANGDGNVVLSEFLRNATTEKARQNRTRDFRRRDRNGDGQVTFCEYYLSRTNAKYWRMDRDGDMEVSLEEFVAAPHVDTLSRPEAAFQALDRDKDGAFTITEYVTRPNDVPSMFGMNVEPAPNSPPSLFARIDSNGDGVIVTSEVATEGIEATARFVKELAAMDSDGDEKVTFGEFSKRKTPFDIPAWNTDQNGFLSLGELRTSEFHWATDSHAAAIVNALDQDDNGEVSFGEFASRSKLAPFLLADWDEDGSISIEEFACQNASYCDRGQVKHAFECLDRDGDAGLSQEELTNTPVQIRFLDRGTNGDGAVDKAEFCSQTRTPEEKAGREADFAKKDQDNNGALSQEEFLAGAGQ